MDGESGLHSQPIAVEIAAEAAQFRRTCGLNIGNPLIELGPASLTDQDHEALCQPPARRQLTTSAAQLSKKHAFGVVEFRTASQKQPAESLGARQYAAERWRRLCLAPILHKSSDRSLAAAIPERLDLVVQVGCGLAAFPPTTDKVWSEPIESAWPLTSSPSQIRSGTDPHEFTYCCAIEAELVSDRGNRQASDTERVDLGVTTFVPNLNSAQRREGRCGSLCIERRQLDGRALFVQWRQHAHGNSLKSIREVVDDVPSIGDLHGIWSAAPRRTCVHTGFKGSSQHLRKEMRCLDQSGDGPIGHSEPECSRQVVHRLPVERTGNASGRQLPRA